MRIEGTRFISISYRIIHVDWNGTIFDFCGIVLRSNTTLCQAIQIVAGSSTEIGVSTTTDGDFGVLYFIVLMLFCRVLWKKF